MPAPTTILSAAEAASIPSTVATKSIPSTTPGLIRRRRVAHRRLRLRERARQVGRQSTLSNFENVLGSAFNDTITGDGGKNVLIGQYGSDRLRGGGGADTLHGGDGNDTLDGGSGANLLDGGDEIDTVTYASASHQVPWIWIGEWEANTMKTWST